MHKLELDRFLILLRIQDRAERGKVKELHRKNLYWEGGHRTYFLDGGDNWDGENPYTERGGTAHSLLWGE